MDSSALWRRASTRAVSLPGLLCVRVSLELLSSSDSLLSSDLVSSSLDLVSSSGLEASSQSD